jgi:hypothetical protein
MDFLTSFFSSALASLVPSLFGKGVPGEKKSIQKGGIIGTGVNYGNISQTTNNHFNEGNQKPNYKFKESDNNNIKRNARLLFVDDQDQTSTIKNLKKLGWQNAVQIEQKEILNTDYEKYKDADLIFVDFSNIGPRHGQGLSILSSLRTKYGRKKFYILYTAHAQKITLQKLEEIGLPIQDKVGWSQLTKGCPDYLLETTMFNGLKQIEQ